MNDAGTVEQKNRLDSVGNDWIVLARIGERKQSSLAQEVAMDRGTFSEFVNNKAGMKVAQFRLLLDALGLKCVDKNARCVRQETFNELTRLAGRVLLERPQLVWEDET